MSLEALAPDQRAVVQLVLQQDRSYEDLAALLGITPEAVRERAHRGLERLAPGEAVDPADRAQIADYLLGQQSVSGRESTRGLMSADQPARSWAEAVAAELSGVARGALPEIPAGATPVTEPEPLPTQPEPQEPLLAGDTDPILADPIAPRARPRTRQRATEAAPPADFGFGEAAGEDGPDLAQGEDPAVRTSRAGGALLIAGLAIFVAALVIWLVNRGDDDTDRGIANEVEATVTPSDPGTGTTGPTGATPTDFQAFGLLRLGGEGEASARVILYSSPSTQQVAFNVIAKGLEPSGDDSAYGMWLTGGSQDYFLGFADPVPDSGKLRVSGPQTADSANFVNWLGDSIDGGEFVISRETTQPGASPGEVVISGKLANIRTSEAPAPSPTP